MKKNLILISLVLPTTLFLSGCGASLEQKAKDATLDIISPTTPIDNNQKLNLKQANQSQDGKNQVPTNLQKANMPKTLADFAPIEGEEVTLTTNKGPIVIKLFRDQAPLTTTNFLHLVNDKFYDEIVFHRVIADFMAQVGDPLTKDPNMKARWGTGGPGYTIQDEFSPELKHNKAGIVSMANTGQPNTGGSQFFITFAPTPWLDGKHAVFGEVIKGMNVVNQLKVRDKIISATITK